ncbi:MAG: hypothetical protein KDD01_02475 [Phaeodactylibacter sp.]|nr:hypothetical protein [Phaeodactylibacter sp.]
MNIAFKRLFQIKILNRYYRDWICSDFTLEPTAVTQQLLANYGLLFRNTGDGGVVLAQVDSTTGLLKFPVSLTEGFKLTFELQLNNPFYANFTSLPFEKPEVAYLSSIKPGYYFTNRYDNEHTVLGPEGSNITLNLISRASGDEISEEDRLLFLPKIPRIHFAAPVNSFNLAIKQFDGSDALPALNINETFDFTTYDVKQFKSLPSGFYFLNLDASGDQPIYLDDGLFHRLSFGLVDIFHNGEVPDGAGSADYRFITGAGNDTISEKTYHLWFDNRELTWRYFFPGGTTGITAFSSAAASFTLNASTNTYESNTQIKLQEAYLNVSMTRNGTLIALPNPNGKSVKPILDGFGNIIGANADVYL